MALRRRWWLFVLHLLLEVILASDFYYLSCVDKAAMDIALQRADLLPQASKYDVIYHHNVLTPSQCIHKCLEENIKQDYVLFTYWSYAGQNNCVCVNDLIRPDDSEFALDYQGFAVAARDFSRDCRETLLGGGRCPVGGLNSYSLFCRAGRYLLSEGLLAMQSVMKPCYISHANTFYGIKCVRNIRNKIRREVQGGSKDGEAINRGFFLFVLGSLNSIGILV